MKKKLLFLTLIPVKYWHTDEYKKLISIIDGYSRCHINLPKYIMEKYKRIIGYIENA